MSASDEKGLVSGICGDCAQMPAVIKIAQQILRGQCMSRPPLSESLGYGVGGFYRDSTRLHPRDRAATTCDMATARYNVQVMPRIPFDQLPSDARLWIFAAERPLVPPERTRV